MVSVAGLTAIAPGCGPTWMVALRLMAWVTVRAAGDAAAAVAVAAGASKASAAVARMAARWLVLMMAASPAGNLGGCSGHRPARGDSYSADSRGGGVVDQGYRNL